MIFAVGTYTTQGGPGVALIRAEKKKLELLCASDAVANPTWVMQSEKDHAILYAAGVENGTRDGVVASFRMEKDGLALVSKERTGGIVCCHVCTDEDESHLYASNYLDGTVSVFPLLPEGKIGPCMQEIRHEAPLGPNKARQECSHAHQLIFRPGGEEAFGCDLGTDQVMIYKREKDGRLSIQETIETQPGIGPRHLLFDGPDRFYLVGELTGWIALYTCKEKSWRCEQLLSTLPMSGSLRENTAAAVRLDGEKLFVSNRGHDSIAVFNRFSNGWLELKGHIPTPGKFPRDFRLFEGGFLLAQQNAGGVAWMDANGSRECSLPMPGAVCLCPLKS